MRRALVISLCGWSIAGCGDAWQQQSTATTPAQSQVYEENETQVTVTCRDVPEVCRTARRFLTGYLPYTYGQIKADGVRGVTEALQRRIQSQRPRVPPALKRGARPKLTKLDVAGTSKGRVLLTASVEDGIAPYVLLLDLRQMTDAWLVADVRSS